MTREEVLQLGTVQRALHFGAADLGTSRNVAGDLLELAACQRFAHLGASQLLTDATEVGAAEELLEFRPSQHALQLRTADLGACRNFVGDLLELATLESLPHLGLLELVADPPDVMPLEQIAHLGTVQRVAQLGAAELDTPRDVVGDALELVASQTLTHFRTRQLVDDAVEVVPGEEIAHLGALENAP